jgi:hypothetical protein
VVFCFSYYTLKNEAKKYQAKTKKVGTTIMDAGRRAIHNAISTPNHFNAIMNPDAKNKAKIDIL